MDLTEHKLSISALPLTVCLCQLETLLCITTYLSIICNADQGDGRTLEQPKETVSLEHECHGNHFAALLITVKQKIGEH